nr:hypothetical protein CFP56_38795 [Quercus suber]
MGGQTNRQEKQTRLGEDLTGLDSRGGGVGGPGEQGALSSTKLSSRQADGRRPTRATHPRKRCSAASASVRLRLVDFQAPSRRGPCPRPSR